MLISDRLAAAVACFIIGTVEARSTKGSMAAFLHPLPLLLQNLSPGRMDRHRHAQPYIAIVLEGRYQEAGDRGRWSVEGGDVLVHRPYEGHFDCVPGRGARVLNVPIDVDRDLPAVIRPMDADEVIRMARSDPDALRRHLATQVALTAENDWPDLLARALHNDTSLCIGDWAAAHGLTPSTVSRGFATAFGVTPARFRSEVRTRAILAALGTGETSLASIAHDGGFADQAHMTRAVTLMTGLSPGRLRHDAMAKD